MPKVTVLIRSAAMPPEELVEKVQEHGIRAVVDLRTYGEDVAEREALAAVGSGFPVRLEETDRARLLEHAVAERLKPHGLTPTQYNVLRILRGAPKGLPCQAIAERMITRLPDITRLLDRLEASPSDPAHEDLIHYLAPRLVYSKRRALASAGSDTFRAGASGSKFTGEV